LGLIVSSWISQEITAAAALIVVVIFRNEIRSVLQTKNIRGILWELPKRSTTTPIETLAESAFKMAHKRIGALIVVPGRDDLEEIVHHGLGWQGTISNEMIMSVFCRTTRCTMAPPSCRTIGSRKSGVSCPYRCAKTCRRITARATVPRWG
ncbi:MAG: hypothetical protein EHM37_23865, partial [Deltaproteobacteria bacterium]